MKVVWLRFETWRAVLSLYSSEPRHICAKPTAIEAAKTDCKVSLGVTGKFANMMKFANQRSRDTRALREWNWTNLSHRIPDLQVQMFASKR